jgi:hypothetical protein
MGSELSPRNALPWTVRSRCQPTQDDYRLVDGNASEIDHFTNIPDA